jgi:hypothetical protein
MSHASPTLVQQCYLPAFLERLAVLSLPIFIAADLNIRLDRSGHHHSVQLRSVFSAFGFLVSNSGPTHWAGGTIDILAFRLPVPLSTVDVDCSDHRLLSWLIALRPPVSRPTLAVDRFWCCLDLAAFRSSLVASRLCQSSSWPADSDAAAILYDDVIKRLLDDLVPVRAPLYRRRPSDPWFDGDFRSAKRYRRRLGLAAASARRSLAASPDSDAAADAFVSANSAWLAKWRAYRQLHRRKCSSFWSNEFAAADSPQRIWYTVDRPLGRGRRACDSVSADAL